LALVVMAGASRGELVQYYVGRDLRQTIPSGVYSGLANPNFNRLTMLLQHGDHYHGKSTYSYVGPNKGADTQVVPYSATSGGIPTNYVPEGMAPPIALMKGDGVFAGKYISGLTPGLEYADIEFGSVDALAGFAPGSAEDVLWRSSGGRWMGSMANTVIDMVLVDISPGLVVAASDGTTLMAAAGDVYSLGDGGAGLSFRPVFVSTAAPGALQYASFKFVDRGTGNSGGPWLESGVFQFNFQVVPEPSSLALGGVGGLLVLVGARRRLLRARRAEAQVTAG
jgi:hypothetical protein